MLPGVTGSLIGSAYLAELATSDLAADPSLGAAARRLHRWWRRVERSLGPASSARAIADVGACPLAEALGLTVDRLEPHDDVFAGVLTRPSGARAAICTTTWDADLDRVWRDAVRAGRMAGARWGVIYSGPRLRIVDAVRTWSRRALEFHLASALAHEPGARVLVALVRAAVCTPDDPQGLDRLVERCDAHGVRVCSALGDGVLAALGDLFASLVSSRPGGRGPLAATTACRPRDGAPPEERRRGGVARREQQPAREEPADGHRHETRSLGRDTSLGCGQRGARGGTRHLGGRMHRDVVDDTPVFEQALTLVYRLLFLLFAESRAIVPTWHHVYRDSYTVGGLCRRALHGGHVRGLWQALQAISRLAHSGCRAGDLVVAPFNGRLFSPRHTPLGERGRVPDQVAGRVIVALATIPGPRGRERIAYADLGVEQLGAVYERVLEYEPARLDMRPGLARTSVERKSTGSFYTPRAMAEFLVRRALHPLVAGRSSDEILALRVVDPAMGSGAFLVAACRYLARALERALVLEGRLPERPSRADRASLRQAVAQRCLFGVDANPMAVQLARLSLWLATLSGDRPLTFLDHHLAVGDSLLGAWVSDLSRAPVRRARPESMPLPLFDDLLGTQLAARVLPERFRIACEPGRTPGDVRAKEQALAALDAPGSPLAGWKAAADLWCAAWCGSTGAMTPGLYADLVASMTGSRASLPDGQRAPFEERARTAAAQHRFFHWELEFPEVFFSPDGRRLEPGGFDAVVGNPPWEVLRADLGDARARERARRDHGALLRFVRESGVYHLHRRGHANKYQLFVERALQLGRPGGRLALVLPSGLATDHGSSALRRALFDTVEIDRVIGFENRDAIFPIHRDVRFLLVTGTLGGSTDRLIGVFGRTDARWLDRLPDACPDDGPDVRSISVSRTLLEEWDPDHLSIPLLCSPMDLEILASVRRAIPRLGDPAGWNVRFARELNASDDRPHLVPRDAARADLLPVIEGKHVEPFRVKLDAATLAIPRGAAARLDARGGHTRARLAYRDVASATNRLTLIAAMLPAHTLSTHTLFCVTTPLGAEAQYCLLALLNSLVANYLVRLQMTTHVTASLMARLPVPCPPRGSAERRALAGLARGLERTGIDADPEAYARLNALAASLYGLTPGQYAHIVSSFPLLPERVRCVLSSEF